MARRHAEKSATQRAGARGVGARAADHAGQAAGAIGPAGGVRIDSLEGRLVAMEQERDFLRAQVESLKSRLRQLEEGQVEACNRLSWAIDAMQSILDDKG